MDNVRHTPGPWKVGSRYGNLHTEIAAPGYVKAVAYCWTHKDANQKDDKACRVFNEDAEGIANARLIAAAPELLEALTLAVQVMRDNNIDDAMSGEFDVFTDALSKATA